MATGHRIRVVRIRDGAVMYDSQTAVASVNEMILDTSGFVGNEQYNIQAMHVDQGDQTSRVPILGRQTMVAMCLQK